MSSINSDSQQPYEVIVLGAGVGGIYQIKRLTDLGISSILLETEADLGGTWYRNRYPGSRFDSESYTYGYSFSQELLDEWHWKERFSPQPENLRYLNYVADKFDLRKHMRFNSRVVSMQWDEDANLWHLFLEDGTEFKSWFVITTIGLLSAPTLPRIEGMETFAGEAHHTFYWPSEPVPMEGRKVGVIGTGATGIQVIAEIADKVGELWVFQRRPNWSAPLNNSPISEEEMADIRSRYPEILARCDRTPGSFEHEPDRRGFWNVSREERLELWDRLYDEPGFGIWLQNFTEIFTDDEANAEFSAYIADRIRQRVDDPEVAEKLIPKDHGFGVQRVPLETHYFEAFNRDNVHLVDLLETPIERIVPEGVQTTDHTYPLDLLVYATGFDAVTGAFDRIDIQGVNGDKLATKWADGPSTYLGIGIHGFPNMMMVAGPQSASSTSNFPRGIERLVDWITDAVVHFRNSGVRRVEASAQSEAEWTQHIEDLYQPMLMKRAQGWFTGYNSNVEGHGQGTVRYVVYNGGAPKYAKLLGEIAQDGYRGFETD
ncbi:MAG: NAD(P)/FAD-dependent oxidoreductase [Acidimicrobiales bacterium]|nr:NAD(P)/FAD-dependent oxidoreductase [Acidimicrobiales bacterium]